MFKVWWKLREKKGAAIVEAAVLVPGILMILMALFMSSLFMLDCAGAKAEEVISMREEREPEFNQFFVASLSDYKKEQTAVSQTCKVSIKLKWPEGIVFSTEAKMIPDRRKELKWITCSSLSKD